MLEGMSAFRFDVKGEGAPAAGTGDDKRFTGEAWRSDPRYSALSNAYLAYAEFLQKGSMRRRWTNATQARRCASACARRWMR